MDLIEDGKEYWEIVSRVRRHNSRPLVVKVAITELNTLIAKTRSDAVRKRCLNWVARNQPYSPSNNPSGSGPRYA